MDRLDEALAMAERAKQLDPINSVVLGISNTVYEYLRRYDEVIEIYQKALQTSPNDFVALNSLWYAYNKKGMYEESLEYAQAAFTVMGMAEIADAMARGYEVCGYSGAMTSAAEAMAEF